MRRSVLIALAVAGCAGGSAAPRDRVPPAALAGEPVSCIPIILIRESRVRSDRVIDFVMKNRRVYRNTLPYACPNLGFERRISYSTPLTQLCSTDIVTVITTAPIGRGASCGLGPFQPVDPVVGRR